MRKLFLLFAGLLITYTCPSFAADATLRWLGHAAFVYTTHAGKVILIDPWITNPKAPKDVQFTHVDGILITHAHFDHVGEAFELAKKFNAPIIAPYEITAIAEGKGVKNTLPINPSGSQHLGEVTITAVTAIHSSSYKDGNTLIYGGTPVGYIIQDVDSPTLYHAGDTGVFADMALIANLYHPQIAMLPIGGVFTMKPMEAAKATQLLMVRKTIPMHFGTFPALSGTPADEKKELLRLGLSNQLYEMTPGQEVKVVDILR